MQSIQLLIVEDELLIAEDLRLALQHLGYGVLGIARDEANALRLIQEKQPDLILLDITLAKGSDGVSVAEQLRKNYDIPFIFLTSHADRKTIQRASATHPYGYLIKPFNREDIFAAIEVALANHANTPKTHPTEEKQPPIEPGTAVTTLKNTLVIKENLLFIKIPFEEITFVEAQGNYLKIVIADGSHHIARSSLKELEQKLSPSDFVRIHKSYLVRIQAIESATRSSVFMGEIGLPLGRTYRATVQKILGAKP